MTIRDVMSTRVRCVVPEVPLSEVAAMLRDNQLACIPVVANDELVGMVTDQNVSDHVLAPRQNLDDFTAGDVMTRGMFYCFEDEELEKAVSVMREKKVHHLAVLDRHRVARIVGIVSTDDFDQP